MIACRRVPIPLSALLETVKEAAHKDDDETNTE
jgi:hypothetical protein